MRHTISQNTGNQNKNTLRHRNPVSAYHDLPLRGRLRSTWPAGRDRSYSGTGREKR